MQARAIKAKQILSKLKEDSYFGISYNMNIYRGCQHACIYCDSRSKCYQLGELHDIRYKENALKLLRKELASKRSKGCIGFGSMNDPYLPVEKELRLTREALKIITEFRFPIHIITKNDLVLRDLDLLKLLSKHSYVAISFSITEHDDTKAKLIEPNSTLVSKRFEAIKTLGQEGIYSGICMMPVLPFISDTIENISQIINSAAKSKAKYLIPFLGVTLREGSREYFYTKLDELFPGIKEKYINAFDDLYACNSPKSKELYALLYQKLELYNIPDNMQFYKKEKSLQQRIIFD